MRSTTIGALLLVVALSACKNNTASDHSLLSSKNDNVASAATLTPEQLGELGAAIKKHPDDATRLLSDHGLDQASFERAVRKVAESPEQSKRYAAAYKKAS
jgi:hypothetical protein